MPEYEVVDTMAGAMMEAMEWKNGIKYDDSDSSCGEDHEMDYDT